MKMLMDEHSDDNPKQAYGKPGQFEISTLVRYACRHRTQAS
jgi:hypothetical protein